MRKRLLLKPLLAFVDISILAGAFQLAYGLRFWFPFLPDRPAPAFEIYFQFSFLVGLIGFAMLHSSGMYRLRSLSFGVEDFFLILRAVTFSALIIMAMNFVLRGYTSVYDLETYSRLIILISWFLSLMFLTLWRLGGSLVFKQLRRQGRGLRNVIIIGTDEIARGFYKAIRDNVDFEYRPLGFVYNGLDTNEREVEGLEILGNTQDLPEIFRTYPVNEVVLACMDIDPEVAAQLIKVCERGDVQFSMIPGFFEILTRRMQVQEVADIPIFRLEERIFQRWGRIVKRGMDIGLSLITLVLCAPFLVLTALIIKLESRGPVIFKHARVGKGERVFSMYKFRSMYADAEEKQKELETQYGSPDALFRPPKDERVTLWGRILRRFSIDEIPQLINVLKGEMSLVGPRPHMPSEVAKYHEWHRLKFDVIPGITGLTQVSGRKNLILDEMVRLDIYYIESWTPWLDLKILVQTIPTVLGGRGAY